MGTNYYLHGYKPSQLASDPPAQNLHIGKSSFGWCFALHVIPEQGIMDLSDWEVLFQDPRCTIYDEYGSLLQPYEMLTIIGNRVAGPEYHSLEFLRQNYAEEGPDGLLRSVVGQGSHCVGHGEGTWDLIEGEFC